MVQVVGALLVVVPLLLIPVRNGNDGLMNIVESLGALERVALWQRAVGGVFGTPITGWSGLDPIMVSTSVRIGLVLMFVAQAAAFRSAIRRPGASLLTWMVGPIVTHAVMLGMVPSNADIFYYEMSGDLANNGVNVYLHRLDEFPSHPILPYNHWVDLTTVYGPVWTRFNQALMAVTGPDPVAATWLFKLALGAIAFTLMGVVFWLTGSLTGDRGLAIAAAVLVAWQPNMIIDSTGQVHSDAAMLLLSTAGMAVVLAWGRTAVRGGVILIALSAMIKYVTLPLLAIIALTRLWDRPPPGRLVRSWTLDVVAFLAVGIAAFLPFWGGLDTFSEMISEPGRLFANPFWLVQSLLIGVVLGGTVQHVYELIVRTGLQLATLAGLALGLWTIIGHVRTSETVHVIAEQRALLRSWAIVLFTLAFIPVNSHAWYWTWPVVPIAVLLCVGLSAQPPGPRVAGIPRWCWWYLTLTALMTIVYHTRIVH